MKRYTNEMIYNELKELKEQVRTLRNKVDFLEVDAGFTIVDNTESIKELTKLLLPLIMFVKKTNEEDFIEVEY